MKGRLTHQGMSSAPPKWMATREGVRMWLASTIKNASTRSSTS